MTCNTATTIILRVELTTERLASEADVACFVGIALTSPIPDIKE